MGVDSLDLRAGADSMAVDAMQPGPLVQRWQVVSSTLRGNVASFCSHFIATQICVKLPVFVPVLVLVLYAPPCPSFALGSVCRLMAAAGFETSW